MNLCNPKNNIALGKQYLPSIFEFLPEFKTIVMDCYYKNLDILTVESIHRYITKSAIPSFIDK